MSRDVIKTLELSDPIHYGGKTITQLEFVKPRVGHLRTIDSHPGQFGQGIALVASLCDLGEEAVEELTAEDFQKAAEIIAGFFDDGGSD